jgi:hypothetical protein
MKRVSLKMVLFFGLLTLLAAGGAGAQNEFGTTNDTVHEGHHAENVRKPEAERLRLRIQETGTLRVIIRVATHFVPEGRRPVKEVETQRANIVQAVERLLDRMPGHRKKTDHEAV